MRILMVSRPPLVRELGAGRVQLDLAEELRRLGHTVDTFDSRDAFGDRPGGRIDRMIPLRFGRKARDYLRQHGRRYDIVEALQGTLPFSKQELSFEGLVVSRSTGLHALYAAFASYERERWRSRVPGSVLGRTLHRWDQRWLFAAGARSLETCDLIRVLNEDEEAYVRDELGLGHKCVRFPEGLADEQALALAAAAAPARERLAAREVAVIGSWSLRKGAADWGEIVARTRTLVPGSRFRFLGTGVESSTVLGDLGVGREDGISVVPYYRAGDLPALLRTSTVGALPSYVEGWGLGVLEQLAAGVPSIAYDVPGPRSMLSRVDARLMAPRGDVETFSDLLAEILSLPEEDYRRLSADCVELAARFRLPAIARELSTTYAQKLADLR